MSTLERAKKLFSQVRSYTRDLERHDALRAASAIAFHAFFSLVPLAALVGWAAHELTQSRAAVLEPVLRMAPSQVARLADEEFMRLSEGGSALVAPLGAAGFLWASSGGIAAAMRVFERIFEAPNRSWWRRRSLALGYVLVSIVVLSLAGLVTLLAAWADDTLGALAGVLVPLVGLWLLTSLFFHYATDRAHRRGFVGALVTVVLFSLVSLAFSLWVRDIASYSVFYGSLAAVVVTLAWLWLMALSLIIGGEVNARLEGVRR